MEQDNSFSPNDFSNINIEDVSNVLSYLRHSDKYFRDLICSVFFMKPLPSFIFLICSLKFKFFCTYLSHRAFQFNQKYHSFGLLLRQSAASEERQGADERMAPEMLKKSCRYSVIVINLIS